MNEVWAFIKSDTKNHNAGEKVYTTLLGKVRGVWRDGKIVSIIPNDLSVEARHHGFCIVGASVQDGIYILEKLNDQ